VCVGAQCPACCSGWQYINLRLLLAFEVDLQIQRFFGLFCFVSFRFVSQSIPLLPVHSRCRGFLFSLDHTQTHTTVGRSPLDKGSARRRDLYLTTQTLCKRKKIHGPGGIRTNDPSKRSAALGVISIARNVLLRLQGPIVMLYI
jgi:hypothetical protein